MNISYQSFGTTPEGSKAVLWTLENSSGYSLSLTDWGATIVSVKTPDRNGRIEEITLGFKNASEYISANGYIGATCGRVANRIGKGLFTLEGKQYELICNYGNSHLHGGEKGFNERLWKAEPYSEGTLMGIVFTYISPDGEENYPGTLTVRADYALDEDGKLYMDFQAETDKTTIVNITNHAYWNLNGRKTQRPDKDIFNHILKLNSSDVLPVDNESIPTGEKNEVSGTEWDFREAKKISKEYDNCMIIDGSPGEIREAAQLWVPDNGRKLTLYTNRHAVQLYTGNSLNNPFKKHDGVCLEPEDYPDAPNKKNFPSIVLKPGEIYRHRSIIEFSVTD